MSDKHRIAVLLPGVMGSSLTVRGQTIWGEDAYQNYDLLINNAELLHCLEDEEPADAELITRFSFRHWFIATPFGPAS